MSADEIVEPIAALEAEADRTAARIRAAGEWVSYDLRVLPDVAAQILGIEPATLRNWKFLGKGPRVVTVAGSNRPTYYLIEVLAQLRIDRGT